MFNKKILALLMATSTFNALAADYYVLVPIAGRQSVPVTVTLAENNLPDGEVNKPYAGFNFQLATQVSGGSGFVLDTNALKFTATNLPPGMVLGTDGILAGTPTTKNTTGTTFTVTATYNDSMGQQNYVLKVGNVKLHVTQIKLGDNHVCALTTSGGVKCWGRNTYGQLGDGSDSNTTAKNPVDVAGLTSGVVNLTSGNSHSCAVLSTGSVKCWGQGVYGALGNGVKSNSNIPVSVVGLANAAKVSADEVSTCVITTAGGVKCWGNNTVGQLGNGSNTESLTPVDVTGLTSGVADLKKNSSSSCALTSAGGLKCWGRNNFGQLGNASTTSSNVPVDVVGLTSNVVSVGVGYANACAVTTAGEVKCWGFNAFGQIGDNTTTNKTTPVTVSGLTSGAASIAVGKFHACARMTAGNVKCWGLNSYGQLGNGTTVDSYTPVDVLSLAGVLSIEASSNFSCAITNAQNTPKCWGANNTGQFGNNGTTNSAIPVDAGSAQ